jgi:VanZ family protein
VSLWLPVVVYMAAISYGAALSQTPGPAARIPDTMLHIGGYAGLSLLTLRATARGRWAGVSARPLLLAFVIAVVHGATVEIEQLFVPTRFAEWRDLGNDAIGAAVGLLGALLWRRWRWSKITA